MSAQWLKTALVAATLDEKHYLGATKRGVAWQDEFGIIVVAAPTSRRLPITWLELTRWCIISNQRNAGSQQWGRFVKCLREKEPLVTTIVSYSDPGVGHTGALYKACNWLWAPTWHRIRPPPTGNGSWKNERSGVKDRWVFPLKPDPDRVDVLRLRDNSILKKHPWALYTEPMGVRKPSPSQTHAPEASGVASQEKVVER